MMCPACYQNYRRYRRKTFAFIFLKELMKVYLGFHVCIVLLCLFCVSGGLGGLMGPCFFVLIVCCCSIMKSQRCNPARARIMDQLPRETSGHCIRRQPGKTARSDASDFKRNFRGGPKISLYFLCAELRSACKERKKLLCCSDGVAFTLFLKCLQS